MAEKQTGKKKGGTRKHHRSKRKALGRMTNLSLFARGKITAETYFKRTKQKTKMGE